MKAYMFNTLWDRHPSALHLCAAEGLEEAVEVVLGEMASVTDGEAVAVDTVDDWGATPLFYAARGGHDAVVRMLAERFGADVNSGSTHTSGGERHESCPLLSAAFHRHTVVVTELLQQGADPNYRRTCAVGREDDETVLLAVCGHGREASADIVRLLLAAGADPNAVQSVNDGHPSTPSALGLAAANPEVVSLLLEYGADVNYRTTMIRGHPDDTTPLHLACRSGEVRSVRRLVDAGAAVDAYTTAFRGQSAKLSPLHIALAFMHYDCASVLMSVDATDPFTVEEEEGGVLSVPPILQVVGLKSLYVLLDSRPSA